MANADNLKGHGFHERTASELREISKKGGKKSGETRRKKAEFKRVLNAMLTAKIENPEWEPTLAAMGLECTLESIVNARMILEAMNGNVKAYEAIAKYSGQDIRYEEEKEEAKMKVDIAKRELNQDEEKQEEIKIVMEGGYTE